MQLAGFNRPTSPGRAGLGTSLRGSICIHIILYWWKLPERLQTHERLARLLFKGREVLQDNLEEVFRVVFVRNFHALEFSLRVREEDLDGRYQHDLDGGGVNSDSLQEKEEQ